MNRQQIRENIFKLLYCQEFHNLDEMPAQNRLYFENNEELKVVNDDDAEYISSKAMEVAKRFKDIDSKINEVAIGWSTDRMSKVDLSILRLAYYEMKFDEEIPDKVAINQAVELAKKYGTDNSQSFVNGILAKLI